ncbi:hypothetical protein GOV11_05400 [Candidatus Woesearchaeota archaeon]|nr:hypothetical protein [Candidatus Woesearchaeota archaeon]
MNVLRYPRLDTVIMVEDTIKKYDGEYTRTYLWRKLPKKMMYQTFKTIIEYLLHSHRISEDSKGTLGWIYYPERVRQHLKEDHLFWRKSSGK